MTILEVHNLKKVYTTRFGGNQVQALRNIQFSVEEGEYVAIMGESGSGKTTLLNILAALDRPTEGEVLLNGKNLVTVREKEIAAFRREHLGFVFQDFHLLDNFSLKDNIFLPLVLSNVPYKQMNEWLYPILPELDCRYFPRINKIYGYGYGREFLYFRIPGYSLMHYLTGWKRDFESDSRFHPFSFVPEHQWKAQCVFQKQHFPSDR